MTPQEMLESTRLNWHVKSEGLKTESGLIIPNTIAIVREDTEAVLGIHGAGYVPYQNIELMELLYAISQSTGLKIHSSGLFDEGKKVWIQLKSDDLRIGNDKVEGYLSGINSFDGSTSLSFGNANLTISCRNSFWMGYRQMNTKIRHSASMKARIDEILRGMDILIKEEKQVFKEIIEMSETKITPVMIELVKKRLFNLENEDKLDRINNEELSTRMKNNLIRFDMDLNTELKDKEDSVWGLFSGVTRYTTHSISKNYDKNQLNKMFGHTGEIERKLFHELHNMI